MTVELNNESGESVDEKGLARLAEWILDQLRIHRQAELSIVLVDEETMAAYHQQYMDLPGPTDVMSFPMDELRIPDAEDPAPEGILGDIMLCPTVTARQAADHDRTPDAEAEYLLVHGILHLLGYDHATDAEREEMFGLHHRLLDAYDRQRHEQRPAGEATDPRDR